METGEAQWKEKISEEFNWKEIFGSNSRAQKSIEAFITQTLESLGREIDKELNKSTWINANGEKGILKSDIDEIIDSVFKKYGVDIGGKGK